MRVRDSIKRLDYLSLDDLIVIQGDLKNLEKAEYEQLRQSILDFGFVSPFHIWEDNGQLDVLDGTQRTRALKTMRDVEGIEIPDKFPCVIIDAPDKDTARKILLVLTSQYGRMTDEGLSAYMIDSGLSLDFLKKYTRFPEVKFDDILDSLLPDNEGLCDEDEVPEVVEPKTKLGDLYQLGEHRLLCGDSTSIDAVERLMNGEKADMVFTDPPYGIKYDDTKHKDYGSYKSSRFGIIKGDDKEFIWTDFEWLDQVEQIWFGANYYCKQLPQSGSWYVWDKKSEAMQENGMLFTNDFELCWSKKKHKQEICRKLWAGAINKEKGEARLHPTQKPISLVEWFFERIKAGSVLDLFGGSGSTLIACEKTNRKCFMMELDPHYCDVIVARWEKYTGRKAELIQLQSQP